ncbi:MAG TPA: lipid-binding SYLF domain-containing protein [bacterium]|nr:lipid-binding SYLF domain-containing protein [bacterium]HOM27254.1 lipid-binding SYLF domain-containing protein [bacterium]
MKKLLILLILLIFNTGFSETKDKYIRRFKVAEDLLEYMLKQPDVSIPVNLIKECYGIIFIRQFKGGFLLAGKGGEGIIISRDREKRTWSAPGFIASIQVSFGWQIGAQMTDLILLIMNEDGLRMLTTSKVKIGADIGVAAGPVGREFEGKVSPGAGILAYGRSKGVFGGLSLEGGAIFSDDKANEEFYGKKGLKLKEIIFDKKVSIPKEAEKLIKLLKDYEEAELVIEKKEKK